MANFQDDHVKSSLVNTSGGGSGINEYVQALFDASLTWDDIAWLKRYAPHLSTYCSFKSLQVSYCPLNFTISAVTSFILRALPLFNSFMAFVLYLPHQYLQSSQGLLSEHLYSQSCSIVLIYIHRKYFFYTISNRLTKLPIVLKGILTSEDALMALKAGADAIWVSNHGARQLDCTPPTVSNLRLYNM